MEIHESLDTLPRSTVPVHLAIGMFDGVHRGHCEVIGGAISSARDAGGIAGVLTFFPHPSFLFRPDSPERQILNRDEKIFRVGEMSPDFLVFQPFTPDFAKLGAADFFEWLRAKIPAIGVICIGENFRFGHGREGGLRFLEERCHSCGMRVFSANDITEGGERISSTRIRKLLGDGEIARANALLGYNYRAIGGVIPGRALGRKIGFPTLNISWVPDLLPCFGVYAVRLRSQNSSVWRNGVANYGARPTVEMAPVAPLLEVHLLAENDTVNSVDFRTDVLEIEWLDFIRGERKFSDIFALKKQIENDTAAARNFFRCH